MTQTPRAGDNEEFWREYLSKGDSLIHFGRRVFTHLPHEPRCRLCTAPFSGIGGSAMRLIGRSPSEANPNVCSACANAMIRHHGGAEVEGTMLFADIRGSTAMAEKMSPGEFHQLLERFYRVASQAVYEHDGVIDKFVGDELVAMFYTSLAGERHVARAIEAAQAVLRATGHMDAAGPWAPVGAGVHTGRVWFGAVGDESHIELTAVGDPVNTTARLAAAASAGEILVSAEAAQAAGLDPTLERKALQLKGKEHPFEVVSLGVADTEVGRVEAGTG
jgi:adenylate cyclase